MCGWFILVFYPEVREQETQENSARRGEASIRMHSHPLSTIVGYCSRTLWGAMHMGLGIAQPRAWNGEWLSTSLGTTLVISTFLNFYLLRCKYRVLGGSSNCNIVVGGWGWSEKPWGRKVKSIQCCYKNVYHVPHSEAFYLISVWSKKEPRRYEWGKKSNPT